MKRLYKNILIANADGIASALAEGSDVCITTTQSGLKIKVLKITILKQNQEGKNASGQD